MALAPGDTILRIPQDKGEKSTVYFHILFNNQIYNLTKRQIGILNIGIVEARLVKNI